MINKINREIWSVHRKSSTCLDLDRLVILGSFEGSLGVLEKKTGKVTWNDLEHLKGQHIISILKLENCENTTILVQTKEGSFSLIEVLEDLNTVTFKKQKALNTNHITLSPFPCHQRAENQWTILTNHLSEDLNLKTIEIKFDYSEFSMNENTSKLSQSPNFLEHPSEVKTSHQEFEHAMLIKRPEGAWLFLLHELLSRFLLLDGLLIKITNADCWSANFFRFKSKNTENETYPLKAIGVNDGDSFAVFVLTPSGLIKLRADQENHRLVSEAEWKNEKETKISLIMANQYLVALTSEVGYLSVHSLKTLKLLTRVAILDSKPHSVAASSKNRLLITADNKSLAFIDVDSLKTK